MISQKFDNSFASFFIGDDGILFFTYKENLELNIEAAKIIVQDRINFQAKKSFPAFVDCRGIKSISKEARDYFAKKGSDLIIASALLYDSPVHKIIANFYLQINKPVVPSKAFTNKEEALKWLEQFKIK